MPGDIADVYLRFEGLTGECNDLKHQGEKGWITIKSFNFGFGFQDGDVPEEEDDDSQSQTGNGASGNQTGTGTNREPKKKKKKSKKSPGMKSGPMTFDCISFTKASDSMSHSLMEACHKGKEIPKVELHACRYGGGPRNEKVPFLHLIFEHVHLKTCKLNLATEGMPTEDVEFEYEKVEMKCMWTDNATGDPLTAQPITAGWDLSTQEEIDEEPPDDEGAAL